MRPDTLFGIHPLDIAKKNLRLFPERFKIDIAFIQNNLGLLYQRQGIFKGAEALFEDALNTIASLSRTTVALILPNKVSILGNIAQLNNVLQKYEKSEKFFLLAMQLYDTLESEDSSNFMALKGSLEIQFGNMYRNSSQYAKAENIFLEAIKVFDSLNLLNSGDFKYQTAVAELDLANVYIDKSEFRKADSLAKAANDKFRILATNNPQNYNSDFAASFAMLGEIYVHKSDYANAETNYTEALNLLRELYTVDSNSYCGKLGTITLSLANFHYEIRNYERGYSEYTDAINMFGRLIIENEDIFLPILASAWDNFSHLCYDSGLIEESLRCSQNALDSYQKLASKSPKQYWLNIINIQAHIGTLYLALSQSSFAEDKLNQAYNNLAFVSDSFSIEFKKTKSILKKKFGDLYVATGRDNLSITFYLESLEIFDQIHDSDVYVVQRKAEIKGNLSFLYFKNGDPLKAKNSKEQEVELYKQLTARVPELYNTKLIMTQINLGMIDSSFGENSAGNEQFLEAYHLAKAMFDKNPSRYMRIYNAASSHLSPSMKKEEPNARTTTN
jgi:tetratricopeptide (TPR) repeat protein